MFKIINVNNEYKYDYKSNKRENLAKLVLQNLRGTWGTLSQLAKQPCVMDPSGERV